MVHKIITEGINHSGLLGIVAVIVLLAVGWFFLRGGPDMFTAPVTSDQPRQTLAAPEGINIDPELVDETLQIVERPGSFGYYDQRYIASLPTSSRIVLFFTSVQCDSCRRLEASILTNSNAIPSDIHIFLVDFVTSPELRRMYNVTVPHSLVEITQDGSLVQSWRASRSLQSILARL